jgi:hypothetical protein
MGRPARHLTHVTAGCNRPAQLAGDAVAAVAASHFNEAQQLTDMKFQPRFHRHAFHTDGAKQA